MRIEFGTGSSFAYLGHKKASSLVDYAVELGITRFDTAVNYGNWETQPLLGRALRKHIKSNREKFVITTKAGTYSSGYFGYSKNFSPVFIENMIEKSISELNCDYIDKFYLHGPSIKQLETHGLLEKLNKLVSQGKIKKFGVNSHNLKILEKISFGYYEGLNLLLIDFNLLQQDRSLIFKDCKKNNIEISAGNTLCQGLLIQSPLTSFLRRKNFFNFCRVFLKKSSRRFINPAKKTREYLKRHYPDDYQSIPLSAVLNNDYVNTIAIGMHSKSSIERNVKIAKEPLNKKVTDEAAKWCLENFQI